MMDRFSKRYWFRDWPNPDVPSVAAGVYVVWEGSQLIYCGMSGREIDNPTNRRKKRYGLITRLGSHASGRLSGDQFCVYVANRIVIPQIIDDQKPEFASGSLTLDKLTKTYIHDNFEYQFKIVETQAAAYALESEARRGEVFDVKPLLNPES